MLHYWSFVSHVCHSYFPHFSNLTYFLSNEQKIESTHLKVNVIFLDMTSNMTLAILPVISGHYGVILAYQSAVQSADLELSDSTYNL